MPERTAMSPLSDTPSSDLAVDGWRQCLDRGGCVVTVNQRLARLLREQFDSARIERGEMLWSSPDVLPWPAWLRRCWTVWAERSECALPALLGPEQALAVWSSIVSEAAPELLRVEEAAQAAAAAWHTLHEYEIDPTSLSGAVGADVRSFLEWAHTYELLAQQNEWIDSAKALRRLAEWPGAGPIAPWEPSVCFAGFDDPPPALRHLMRNMRDGGATVTTDGCLPLDESARRTVSAFAYPDQASELAAAARWARGLVEAEPNTVNGSVVSVGIVVPDLLRRRAVVKRELTAVLDEPACRIDAQAAPAGFELSLGVPLGQLPVVDAALSVLRLTYTSVSLAQASNVLSSPYLSTAQASLSARSALEEMLRARGEPRLSAAEIGAVLTASGYDTHEIISAEWLEEFFSGLYQHAAGTPSQQTLRDAASNFARCLERAGWPGSRGLDSEEFQGAEAFRELLANLPRLGVFGERVAAPEAIDILSVALSRQIFQPQQTAGISILGEAPPIQVTGVLETVGRQFDALWVCSLDDLNWPAAPSPNPFIPLALQRRAGMPRADAEREREVAATWTRRLASAAPEVVFSHAEQVDGEARSLSALVAPFIGEQGDIGHRSTHGGSWLHPWQWIRSQARPLDACWDDRGPPLRPGELGRGGARAFGDQAQCPFRAFALHRLGSRSVSAPAVPLDARSRGLLLHRALDRFWARVSGRESLAELSAAQRHQCIRQAVESALRAEIAGGALVRRQPLAELERERLTRVLDQWLDLELQRADFEVLGREGDHSCEFGGVLVTLRPDRVDRLADGSVFVLDYKSSLHGTAEWLGERPEDPQLPVYALALRQAGEEVGGLGFGVLSREGVRLSGLGREPGLGPGVRSIDKASRQFEAKSWTAVLNEWERIIASLGRAFAEGRAAVDPKSGLSTCRYCEQQPLCRYNALEASARPWLEGEW